MTKQQNPPKKDPEPTNWKEEELASNTLSDGSTRDRLHQPAPASYEDAFEKLGMTLPKVLTPHGVPPITSETQALRELQHRDGLKGLEARAHHTLLFSDLSALRKRVTTDRDLAEGTRSTMLSQINDRFESADAEFNKALKSSPEAFMAAHVAELRSYRREYQRGRIVQTPYVKEKKAEILQGLRSSRMCFVSGETGTGKTEISRIVAREFSGKKEVVVRGYAGMGASELYGHMALTDSSVKRLEQARQEIEESEHLYREKFPDATAEDLASLAQGILSKGGVTTTEYILGAVYRAAKEGRVLIIDEANYIPPELLASLNDIMTKKPGEEINVQQDGVGPIVVQEGFGIIFTGNINPPTGPLAKRYIGRMEFDAAFTDRVPNVSYERLPQALDGQPFDHDFSEKQLFTIAVTTALLPPAPRGDTLEKLESRYGTLFLPGGPGKGLDTLWRFSQFAAVTQSAFQGEIRDGNAHGFRSGASAVGYIPKVQLSNRGVMRVIEQWRNDGCEKELDYYIAKDLFSRAKDPRDRAYYYQLGQFFGFFKSDAWERRPDYSPTSIQHFAVTIPENRAETPDVISAREVIEKLFGEIPPRTEWPDASTTKVEGQRNIAKELVSLEAKLERWKAEHPEVKQLAES